MPISYIGNEPFEWSREPEIKPTSNIDKLKELLKNKQNKPEEIENKEININPEPVIPDNKEEPKIEPKKLEITQKDIEMVNMYFTTKSFETLNWQDKKLNIDSIAVNELMAFKFNYYIVSSSTYHESGSTTHGDSEDDTHDFQGTIKYTHLINKSDNYIVTISGSQEVIKDPTEYVLVKEGAESICLLKKQIINNKVKIKTEVPVKVFTDLLYPDTCHILKENTTIELIYDGNSWIMF